MNLLEAMQARHSVRRYLDKRIEPEIISALNNEITACNKEGGLNIQLITDEPEAFSGFMAHYGSFSDVRNYIALVGDKSPDLEERSGYYGERIVLKAQALGLNTCWVALTYSKRKSKITLLPGQKLVCVISLGYGATQGKPHRSKPITSLYNADTDTPDWFLHGMEAVALAPTAINQQKFLFTLSNGTVKAEALKGPCSLVDMGIAKYHFELGAHGGTWRQNTFVKAAEEVSCGAVVRRRASNGWEYLLIQHRAGHWSFPKGHMEPGESEEDTARREILEETGLHVELDTGFRKTITYYPKNGIIKDVHFFIASPIGGVECAQESEVLQLGWFDLRYANELITFESDREILMAADAYNR